MDAVVSAKGAVMERGEGAPLRAAVAAASGSGTSAVAADADAVWSVDEALQRVQWGLFSWRLMFLCGFCYMSDAVEVMLLGFLQVALTAEWGLSPFEASTLTSVVFAGQLLGSALWGPLADRVGRRVGSFSAAVIVAAFGVLSALVPSYGWMLLCRAIVGFGIAGFTVPFDLLAEYMPHHRRGTFLICFQFFWTAGSLLVATLAWACLAALGWRVLTGLSAIPVVLSTMLYAYLPESPSFLLVRGRPADAVAALTAAAAVNGVALPRFTLRAVPEEVASCSRLFMPRLRSTTLLSWTLWFAFGFSYYGIVLLTPELFAEPAATGEAYAIGYANIFAASAAEIVGVVVTLLVIDRWGRKRTQAVMCTLQCARTRTRLHTHSHTHSHMRARATHTHNTQHTHTHTHSHTHIHTHTHTHSCTHSITYACAQTRSLRCSTSCCCCSLLCRGLG